MFHSRSFIAHVQKARKAAAGNEEVLQRDIEHQFRRQAPQIPEDMTGDLVSYALGARDDRDDQIQLLADLLDLVQQQYDETADPLLSQDWQLVRDLVDQYALELDMSLVQYIMERVVSHHAL